MNPVNLTKPARRIHYLLEPGWRADQAIQGLGRTHRTHQASAPLFRPVTTDVKGERRFIATIARRLDSLGAITRGQRDSQTAMGGDDATLFRASDNLESPYAKVALRQFYIALWRGNITGWSMDRFEDATGLKLIWEVSLKEDLPPMPRFAAASAVSQHPAAPEARRRGQGFAVAGGIGGGFKTGASGFAVICVIGEALASISMIVALNDFYYGRSELTEEAEDELDRMAPGLIPEFVRNLNAWTKSRQSGRGDTASHARFDREDPPAFGRKVGRNEPCPCRSGRKYKRCCGAH